MIPNKKDKPTYHATINNLSHDGRGIAHINDKITFIENALPQEEVNFVYHKQYAKFNTAKAVEILKPSPDRVIPKCKHYNICGGCVLQHLDPNTQVAFKSAVIKEQLKHIGGIAIPEFLAPITSSAFGYRNKARLSVKYVRQKQKVLVGFHEKSEKNGSYVAEIDSCPILHPSVGEKIDQLSKLIVNLSIFQYIPQIEIGVGDKISALVLRNLQPFTDKDINIITGFAKEHDFQIYSQSGGIDSVKPITPHNLNDLSYKLPNQNLEIIFTPTDFTQINPKVNTQLVDRVLELLDLKPNDQILDLFCGIGNFTLPIARKCGRVFGIEGSKSAIMRAKYNAVHNNITNADFYVADLTQKMFELAWASKKYTKILLDPPRTGAQEICSRIKDFGAQKIVYVSCSGATFARDAKILGENGYTLKNITIADMYPHTSHVESVGLFEI